MARPSSLTASIIALTGILTLALTGCSVGAITNLIEGKEDVFSIKVGDCFNDDTSDAEEINAVKMPKCTEEHDNEAYFIYEVTDTDFPFYSISSIQDEAEEGCYAEFESFIGASIDDTSLYYGYYYPSADSWRTGDREILCLAYDIYGPVSEPLGGKGADYPYEG